ncbi:hypothetical protein GLAREA_01470 [Glarea lozoyensis ATCC 20868]|uniref:Uncharacterized protein n=1 Tax=Glarea lozoyensis (strain ATCC 20868 / MF5171) TaxID=1116229 RepID=S3DFZ2_GLAL2|nr:uncharacterized protein GLAREA_01470 [Glarea lozoyensis ATCC 20868]EPE25558.1 hypothetical protein GLAREA_01470 [Glarea lozoyensis ATCC 20868]
MKFIYLSPLLLALTAALPQPPNPILFLNTITTAANIPPNLQATYSTLLAACNAEAANSPTYVAVQYANRPDPVFFDYGECYPYALGNDKAMIGVFCRSVTCFDFTTDSANNPCGTVKIPLGVTLPQDVALINPLGVVGYVGTGAVCYKPLLSLPRDTNSVESA